MQHEFYSKAIRSIYSQERRQARSQEERYKRLWRRTMCRQGGEGERGDRAR